MFVFCDGFDRENEMGMRFVLVLMVLLVASTAFSEPLLDKTDIFSKGD